LHRLDHEASLCCEHHRGGSGGKQRDGIEERQALASRQAPDRAHDHQRGHDRGRDSA
jgi:hypothetical protein